MLQNCKYDVTAKNNFVKVKTMPLFPLKVQILLIQLVL